MQARFSVMTYNVHSCIGRDGTASPERIAEVLALYEVDIICLQELDSGLLRSGKVDQAREIADRLKMDYHFHPALKVEEGEYGNAILSRFPSTVLRGSALPTFPGRTYREQRGALWAAIRIGDFSLNMITTHLGLSRIERRAQAEALLGPEWLGDRKSTRLNSSHHSISYAVFCLKKKKEREKTRQAYSGEIAVPAVRGGKGRV